MIKPRTINRSSVIIFIVVLILLVGCFLQMLTISWLSSFVDVDQPRLSNLRRKFYLYASIASILGVSALYMIVKFFQIKKKNGIGES